MKHIFLILVFYFLFYTLKLYSFYYENNILLNFNYNFNDKSIITRGYWINTFNNNNNEFHIDFLLQEPEYLYNLNHNNNKINFTNHLYNKYSFNFLDKKNSFYVGFMPTLSSDYFYDNFANNTTYYFGFQSLSRLNNSNNFYILSNANLNNNSAFSISYKFEQIQDVLNFALTFTPNMNLSLTNYNSKSVTDNKSLLDGAIIYYDEYKGWGYGLTAGIRQYINTNSQDYSITATSSFLGSTIKIGYLKGNNDILNSPVNTSNYYITTEEIYYEILAIQAGIRLSQSHIISGTDKYINNLNELNIIYHLKNNFYINGAIFYENFDFNNSLGIITGVGMKL